MIKSENLMLGNWLMHKGKYCQVYAIGVKTVKVYFPELLCSKSILVKNLEPVTLTCDILQGCGMNKSLRRDSSILSPCYAKHSFALMIHKDYFLFDWIGGNTKVEQLHQLQNLYFDTVKEHLEITF